jgi:hypothetical protein
MGIIAHDDPQHEAATMAEYYSVSEAAEQLERRHGVVVPPRVLSDLIYQRILPVDHCPIVGGRRLIPMDLLPAIEAKLRERLRLGDRSGGVVA